MTSRHMGAKGQREFIPVKPCSSLGKHGFTSKKEDFPVVFIDKPFLNHEAAVQDAILTKYSKTKILKKEKKTKTTKPNQNPQ